MAPRGRPTLSRSVRDRTFRRLAKPSCWARRLHLSDDVVAEEHRYLGLELLSRARLTKIDNTDAKTPGLGLRRLLLASYDLLIQRIRGRRNAMATKVLTTLQDDIDSSDATQTIRFALDGIEYEIDVSDRNANRLRNSLGDFIAHGRKVGGRRARKTASSSQVDTRAVRKWAKANGIEVSSRGRIPAEVVERYKAAGN